MNCHLCMYMVPCLLENEGPVLYSIIVSGGFIRDQPEQVEQQRTTKPSISICSKSSHFEEQSEEVRRYGLVRIILYSYVK